VEQARGTEPVAEGDASSKHTPVSFILLCDLSIRRTQVDIHIAHSVARTPEYMNIAHGTV
jgi:hypothetical protein